MVYTTSRVSPHDQVESPNVVQRLQRRIKDAKRMGFRVRSEWLDDPQAGWCEIAGVKTLFVDLSQTAAEQLRQIDEILQSLSSIEPVAGSPTSGGQVKDASAPRLSSGRDSQAA